MHHCIHFCWLNNVENYSEHVQQTLRNTVYNNILVRGSLKCVLTGLYNFTIGLSCDWLTAVTTILRLLLTCWYLHQELSFWGLGLFLISSVIFTQIMISFILNLEIRKTWSRWPARSSLDKSSQIRAPGFNSKTNASPCSAEIWLEALHQCLQWATHVNWLSRWWRTHKVTKYVLLMARRLVAYLDTHLVNIMLLSTIGGSNSLNSVFVHFGSHPSNLVSQYLCSLVSTQVL